MNAAARLASPIALSYRPATHRDGVARDDGAVSEQRFELSAEVSSENPQAIEPILRAVAGLTVTPLEGGFHVEGSLTGTSARDLNRALLSALRRAERRTRIRSRWSLGDATFRFFDYVQKG